MVNVIDNNCPQAGGVQLRSGVNYQPSAPANTPSQTNTQVSASVQANTPSQPVKRSRGRPRGSFKKARVKSNDERTATVSDETNAVPDETSKQSRQFPASPVFNYPVFDDPLFTDIVFNDPEPNVQSNIESTGRASNESNTTASKQPRNETASNQYDPAFNDPVFNDPALSDIGRETPVVDSNASQVAVQATNDFYTLKNHNRVVNKKFEITRDTFYFDVSSKFFQNILDANMEVTTMINDIFEKYIYPQSDEVKIAMYIDSTMLEMPIRTSLVDKEKMTQTMIHTMLYNTAQSKKTQGKLDQATNYQVTVGLTIAKRIVGSG